MKNPLVICVANEGYEASLEKRKVYEKIPDEIAATHTQVRVIDESGEDYLIPSGYFVDVALPEETAKAIIAAV